MIYSFDDLTFKILSVNEYEHADGTFQVAGRQYSAFSLRTEGEGVFQVGNERFISRVGDILFIPRDTSYSVEYRASKSVVFHFLECNYNKTEHFSPAGGKAYRLLFEKALRDWKNSFRVNGVKSVVFQILQALSDEQSSAGERREPLFDACVQYVKDNFCDSDLSLAAVCKNFYISPATVRRKFERYYNTTFIKFVAKLRFDKALSMLLEGREKISSIAYACGFKDEKYFSRAFKTRFGSSPVEIVP